MPSDGGKTPPVHKMALDEFSRKGIEYREIQNPYSRPGYRTFRIPELDIEFQTHNSKIMKIWFFRTDSTPFKIAMPEDRRPRKLKDIKADVIIRNFGEVEKHIGPYPPKDTTTGRWIKYRPFGVETNTITYPDSPFGFGLNWDDSLSYIVISDEVS